MVVYSIKEIEELSGVKAHTLRIWEKRYGIIIPNRTKTNIRYYTDLQLKKILNISLLNRNDIKISKIAKLSEEQLKRKVTELSAVDIAFEDQLDSLVLSLLELDSYNFNRIIDLRIDQKGFENTMEEMIYPLMDKLGLMWMAGSLKSVHESFVTSIVKSKIIAATESLKRENKACKSDVMIYLNEGEDHELSLLFLKFLLEKYNYGVINLGLDVGMHKLKEAFQIKQPNYLFTIINESFEFGDLNKYIEEINLHAPETVFLMSGSQPIQQGITNTDKLIIFKSMKETMDYLENSHIKSCTSS